MAVVNKIIHRFVRNRADYFDPENELYDQIIPYNVQAYSYELKENGDPNIPDDYIVRYVLGTGRSTYQQIADGLGKDSEGNPAPELSKEFIIQSTTQLRKLITDIIEDQVSVASYLTSNATGDPFATKAALDAATEFYSNGELVDPFNNDYVIVLADETHPTGSGEAQTARYVCTKVTVVNETVDEQVVERRIPTWSFQYIINNGNFTDAQTAAINSGITAEKVTKYEAYENRIAEALDHLTDYNNPHQVTAEQIGLGNVDNTSDLDKPISTATQEALDTISDNLATHIEDSSVHVTAAEKESWDNKQDPMKMGKHIYISNNTINVIDDLAGYDNSISQFVNKDVDNLTNYYTKDELGDVYRYLGDVETYEDLPDGNIYAPTEYDEVEYLSATQLEYIDTHYNPNQNTEILLKFKINGEGNNYFYGTDVDHNVDKVAFGINYGASTGVALFGKKSVSYTPDGQVHTLLQNKNGIYVDNVKVAEYTGITAFTTLTSLWLFRAQTSDTHPQNISIYDFVISEQGETIKHYVPVIRDVDSKPGLWEVVEEEFIENEYNPEEFDFIAGPLAGYGNTEGSVYKVLDENAFYMWHDNEWININKFYSAGTGINITKDGIISNTFDVLVDGESVVENAVATIDLTGKVDKTTESMKIYGTDVDGNQHLYDKEDFGKVDDVRVKVAGSEEYTSVVTNKIAQIDMISGSIAYTNEAVASIENVQQALDNLMNIHYYIDPKYDTFTLSQSDVYDVGTVLSNPFTITWGLNKQPEEGDVQTLKLIDGNTITVICNIMEEDQSKWKAGSYIYSGRDFTYNTPKIYTIKADYTDNHSPVPQGRPNSCSSSKTFEFRYRRYWGVTSTETLTDEQLYELSNELSTVRTQTGDFDCTGGKYWWFVIPTIYCSNISFTDVSSGLPMTLPPSCISTRTITNSQGVSYSVNVYRGEYKQTASSVKIKVN